MTVVIPRSIDEVVDALAANPQAVLLAGGTDVMVEINAGQRRVPRDQVFVALRDVGELGEWHHDVTGRTVRIGATVTYAEMAAVPLAATLPALGQAARTVGSPQIRNAGTIGGNLATCSPAGDGLPPLAALDTVVHIDGPGGPRDVPVTEFMVGVKRTSLGPGELITAVTVPVLDGWQGYAKVGVRTAMVISIAGVAVAVDRAGRSIRIALGSVAPTVIRATRAEATAAAAVDWKANTIDADGILDAAARAADAATPIDDHRSKASYRRKAVETLTSRLLARALSGGEEVA